MPLRFANVYLMFGQTKFCFLTPIFLFIVWPEQQSFTGKARNWGLGWWKSGGKSVGCSGSFVYRRENGSLSCLPKLRVYADILVAFVHPPPLSDADSIDFRCSI